MKLVSKLVITALVVSAGASPQSRPLDWTSYNNDAQRTGWEKTDSRITRENVKDFQLIWKRRLESKVAGPYSLTPPVVLGLLISYRGFKELAFVAGASDSLWAVDADLNRLFWEKHFDSASASGPCAGGVVATPSLTPPMSFARPRPDAPPPPRPAGRGILGASGFGAPRPLFAVTRDGKLHLMNTSTGDDFVPPFPFVPPNAKASSLTVVNNVVYTTTSPECGEAAVWAIDLSAHASQDEASQHQAPVAKFSLDGGATSRLGGLAMGTDGTVYVQSGSALTALSPKELKRKQYFTIASATPDPAEATTPVVFTYKGHDMIVAAGGDSRLYLLDSRSLGGDDHQTPVYQTVPVAAKGARIWGGLSTWQDADGTRWVLAPVWGGVNPELNLPPGNGAAPHGSIVAFKVEDRGGKTRLSPAWLSCDMNSPEPPVITSRVVFALAAGDAAASKHATLYALDAATGAQIYSTGAQVTAPANLTGVTVANGRVFFTTTDGTLYAFGVFLEI